MAATPVDYTARDYEGIKQALIDRIPTHLPEWRNRTENDFGIVLIELFASLGDMLSFYIDRAANEASVQTAVLRESVLAFADLVGYVPEEMVPSAGAVTFTAQPGRTEDTLVPAGTVVVTDTPNSDAPPLPFTTDEDLVIPFAGSTGSVGVTQGLLHNNEVIGASAGVAGLSFSLFETGVVVSSVSVDVVTGSVTTRWTKADSMLEAGSSDQVFTVSVDANDVAFVRFGDGANGLIPPAGSTIIATYRTAHGAAGNISSANVLTVMPEAIDDIVGVTNLAAITGGADKETLNSIRRNLPSSVQAINRAVSPEDFEPLAEKVAGVMHAKATAEVYTSVVLYIVPVGGGTPSPDLQQRVEDYFIEGHRCLAGTDVTVLDPTYVAVNVDLSLFVLPTFYAQETEDRVEDALTTFFMLENTDLGKTINVSDIYRVIHEVPGVDYVEVTLVARADGPQTGTGPEVFAVNEVPTEGTITITTTGGI